MATVYDFMAANNRRIVLLMFLFCSLLLLSVWWISYGFAVAHYSHPPDASYDYVQYTTKQIAKNIVDSIGKSAYVQTEEIDWLAPDVIPAAKSFAWRATALLLLILLWLLIYPPEFIVVRAFAILF